MTNKKFTQLPAASAIASTDLVAIVHDPTGTPVSQKATLAQLFAVAPPSSSMQRVFSTANLGQYSGGDWANGNFTVGWKFGVVGLACTCTGLKFYAQWSGGGSKSIVCKLQDNTGATLATKTVSALSGTVVDVTWNAAVVLAPTNGTTWYAVTIWESTGTVYPHVASPIAPGETSASTVMSFGASNNGWPWFFNSDTTIHMGLGKFASGNNPIANAGNYTPFSSEFYPVEPKFS